MIPIDVIHAVFAHESGNAVVEEIGKDGLRTELLADASMKFETKDAVPERQQAEQRIGT